MENNAIEFEFCEKENGKLYIGDFLKNLDEDSYEKINVKLDKLKKEYRTVSPEVEKQVARDLAFQTGLQIERLRIFRGVTQEKLAKMIGTQQTSISRAESGSILQSLGFLRKIASALNTYVVAPRFAALEEVRSVISPVQFNYNAGVSRLSYLNETSHVITKI